MDAVLPAGHSFQWPTNDVLLPENLGEGRIGVIAWKGAEDDKTLVPVRVTDRDGQTRFATPLLTIQASFDSQQIKWRWAEKRGVKCEAFGQWQDAIHHAVTASLPISIDLASIPAGTHCVEVAAQSDVSTSWNTLKLHVEIPPK